MNLDAALREAAAHHQAGRLAEAARGFERVLQRAPALAPVHVALGLVRGQLGDVAAAARHFRRATQLAPDLPEAWANLAIACSATGAFDDAIDAQAHAVALLPGSAGAHAELGALFLDAGRETESERALRQALQLDPNHAPAHFSLGNLQHRRQRYDEAEACFRRVLELAPGEPQAWYNLGNALREQDRYAAAAVAFQKAVELSPGHVHALGNLAMMLTTIGDHDGAARAADAALALRPAHIDALPSRDEYLAADADFARTHSAALYAAQFAPGLSPAALRARHEAFDRVHAGPLARFRQPHANDRDPSRRLRIGYVSADFRKHPVGYFLAGPLAARERAGSEVFLYSGTEREDELTARLREAADHWRSMLSKGDGALADQVRADGIDILVDLSGHTAGNRLLAFALKPAPVQVSWLGYFATTGLAAMDAVLMDGATVPPAAEGGFTERVVRLPATRFCYAPPAFAPDVAPPPCLASGRITFGSFNNLAKVTADVIALWARVLEAVPGSRLVVKWKAFRDPEEQKRIDAAFARHGIAAERIELRTDSPHAALLAEYGDIDIALDPFPFSGGLTSAEALWMGVPVVTLAGERAVSRQTLAFLAALGLERELATASAEEYVATAGRLAADRDRLAALRGGLRERMRASPLCDAAAFARGLDEAYRVLWRAWCAGRPD